MQGSVLRWPLLAFTVFFLGFLYAPMGVLSLLSFQSGPEGGPQFPIVAWSTYWYQHLFGLVPPTRVAPLPIGAALLRNLECRAAALGAERLFGDTLRSNDAMQGLARKSGYAFAPNPDDWKLVRFEKHVGRAPQDIPCASWRLATANAALSATMAN